MVRMLDTRLIPPAEGKAAYVDQFFDHEVPHAIGFDSGSEFYSGVVDHWRLDDGVHLHRTIDSGTRLLRTQRLLRIAAPERFGIVLKLSGTARVGINGEDRFVDSGEMWLLDQTSPSDYEALGPGGVQALNIDYAQIDLSVDDVRAATNNLGRSPVFNLFRSHLMDLFRSADSFASDPGASRSISAATLSLSKALILTAVERE